MITFKQLYAEMLDKFGNDETINEVVNFALQFADVDNVKKFQMLEQIRTMTKPRPFGLNGVCVRMIEQTDYKLFAKLCEGYEYPFEWTNRTQPYFIWDGQEWTQSDEPANVELALHEAEALMYKLNLEL